MMIKESHLLLKCIQGFPEAVDEDGISFLASRRRRRGRCPGIVPQTIFEENDKV
jgi:hypothetical protein